jgi:FAD binding domain
LLLTRASALADYYDFPTDGRGEVVYRALRGPEYLRAMRRLIEDLGVTVLDHSPALELLQHADGAVAGARGVRRREHRDWTVRAGAVVLATGGCGFRAHAVGAASNTGDGLLMAAEVGAELSGMEFSAMFGPAPAHTNMTRSMSFTFANYTDASGAIPVQLTTMAPDLAAALMRGPVYAQFDRMPTHFREHLKFIQPAFLVGFSRLGIDPFNERFEITLRGEGTIRGVGGIRLRSAATSVGIRGLYAADGKIRERVATAEEAAKLIEALPAAGSSGALSWEAVLEIRASAESAVALSRRLGVSDALVGKVRRGELYKSPGSRRSAVASDRPGWALAFYTGMRRSEIGRAQWPHVFWDADEIMVAASKSDAGEGRRVPMVGPLKKILREDWIRRGQPASGPIVVRSVDSGKWQARADTAWKKARLARVTLRCRRRDSNPRHADYDSHPRSARGPANTGD